MRPGVYVEEYLQPLTQAASASGDADYAFVGPVARGPVGPVQVSSWSQFVGMYGGLDGDYLAYAVYQFFNNGGRACYVVRSIRSDAVAGTLHVADRQAIAAPTTKARAGTTATITTGAPHGLLIGQTVTVTGVDAALDGTWPVLSTPTSTTFTYATTASGTIASAAATGTIVVNAMAVSAVSAGAWAGNVYVEVRDSATAGPGTGRFDLVVRYGGTADSNVVERFADVTLNPLDSRYVVGIVNSAQSGSTYINLTNLEVGTWAVTETPVVLAPAALAGAADGSGSYNRVADTQALEAVGTVLDVNLPGYTNQTDLNTLIAWAETNNNYFLVIDSPATAATEAATMSAIQAYLVGGGSALTPTSKAAIYGPWLNVDDPLQQIPGSIKPLPPGGAVLGRFSQSDATRGVQKAPAGIDIPLRGIVSVTQRFVSSNQDTLNQAGFNLIKPIPGAGICVMGARTLKSGTPDRYVSIRRSLQVIEKSLVDNTRFAIFEPNDSDLWDTIGAILTQYLTAMLQIGVLKGASPEEAFYVKCDNENNSASDAASGIVNVEVGVALASPAEFIVIRIGQFDGGTATSTS
jgi:hypothetical protein